MKRKSGPKSKCPDKKEFIKLYYDKDIEVESLAKLYGVKKQTIYNWAHKIKSK